MLVRVACSHVNILLKNTKEIAFNIDTIRLSHTGDCTGKEQMLYIYKMHIITKSTRINKVVKVIIKIM